MSTIKVVRVESETELYCQYPGQLQQTCYMQLDLADRELSAYHDEPGSGFSQNVLSGRVLTYEIPCLTGTAANRLLEEARPVAERIVAGYESQWDGSNYVGVLSEDARAAEAELRTLVKAYENADQVQVLDAEDYFRDTSPAELGITSDTSPAELAEAARRIEKEVANLRPGVFVIEGTQDYLESLRDTLAG